eukprot:2587869-Prymnesium_polylepis.4
MSQGVKLGCVDSLQRTMNSRASGVPSHVQIADVARSSTRRRISSVIQQQIGERQRPEIGRSRDAICARNVRPIERDSAVPHATAPMRVGAVSSRVGNMTIRTQIDKRHIEDGEARRERGYRC